MYERKNDQITYFKIYESAEVYDCYMEIDSKEYMKNYITLFVERIFNFKLSGRICRWRSL